MKKRKIAIIIASIIVLAIITFAILLFMPSSEVGTPMVFSSDERLKLAAGLNLRAIIFENTLRAHTANRASFDINERELNAYVQSSPEIQKKIQDIGGKDVVVKLHKDRILVGMRVPYKGIMFPASAVIGIQQDLDRKLKVSIESVKIGSFPAPHSLVDAALTGAIKNGSVDLPPGVMSLEVVEGDVKIQANPASIQVR